VQCRAASDTSIAGLDQGRAVGITAGKQVVLRIVVLCDRSND
jgi:hypothetical protein